MASPEEVLEAAIPHPADSTQETRRAAAKRCLQALHINNYAIAYRAEPVTDKNYGPCPACGVDWVHVAHAPPFANADQRMHADRQRILALEKECARLNGLVSSTAPEMKARIAELEKQLDAIRSAVAETAA